MSRLQSSWVLGVFISWALNWLFLFFFFFIFITISIGIDFFSLFFIFVAGASFLSVTVVRAVHHYWYSFTGMYTTTRIRYWTGVPQSPQLLNISMIPSFTSKSSLPAHTCR